MSMPLFEVRLWHDCEAFLTHCNQPFLDVQTNDPYVHAPGRVRHGATFASVVCIAEWLFAACRVRNLLELLPGMHFSVLHDSSQVCSLHQALMNIQANAEDVPQTCTRLEASRASVGRMPAGSILETASLSIDLRKGGTAICKVCGMQCKQVWKMTVKHVCCQYNKT